MTTAALSENLGLTPLPLADAGAAWDQVVGAAGYAPVEYLRSMVKYQSVYVAESTDSYTALDSVLYDGEAAIAVWPLCLRQAAGSWTVGSNADAVLPPVVAASATSKQRKAVTAYALDQIDRLCGTIGVDRWRGQETVKDAGISDWHKTVSAKGGVASVRHDLYLDLTPDLQAIRSCFRKSYRPLIGKAAKLWQCRVIDTASAAAFEDFHALHVEVAGRETRSKRTWNLQRDAVDNGDAFLVMLYGDDDKVVGASLFYHSDAEGIYAVAAYRRSLFDKPVGHLVQMAAIEHMKGLGLKWYRLGRRPYPGDDPAPNEKELSIGFFKEGFASHSFLVLQTDCPASPAGAQVPDQER